MNKHETGFEKKHDKTQARLHEITNGQIQLLRDFVHSGKPD
jgi:hypothetical protein